MFGTVEDGKSVAGFAGQLGYMACQGGLVADGEDQRIEGLNLFTD